MPNTVEDDFITRLKTVANGGKALTPRDALLELDELVEQLTWQWKALGPDNAMQMALRLSAVRATLVNLEKS